MMLPRAVNWAMSEELRAPMACAVMAKSFHQAIAQLEDPQWRSRLMETRGPRISTPVHLGSRPPPALSTSHVLQALLLSFIR